MSDATKQETGTPASHRQQKGGRSKWKWGLVCVVTCLAVLGFWTLARSAVQADEQKARAGNAEGQTMAATDSSTETNQMMTLQAFLKTQHEILETYAVLDPEKGIIRIPIERAMELILERGMPQWTDE